LNLIIVLPQSGAMTDRTPGLAGVPETLLWNLYQRASEARRPDAVLRDPKAVELVDGIDYPFAERFGGGGFGQWQALRALRFDLEVQRFLSEHPAGTVVALGEGLETQFWRVDNGRVHWLTVDVPETVELRERLLGAPSSRQRTITGSAFDPDWMDQVDATQGLLITAQGLLMYFPADQVHQLIARCAARFRGGDLILDGVPPWFSARTLRGEMRTGKGGAGGQGYQAPPMPWALDVAEKQVLRGLDPNIAEVRDLRPPRGRGVLYGVLFPLLNRIAAVRALGVTGLPIIRVSFR
jgi:O-methyltransferase involved in polyketide biosynthesis